MYTDKTTQLLESLSLKSDLPFTTLLLAAMISSKDILTKKAGSIIFKQAVLSFLFEYIAILKLKTWLISI